MNFSDYEISYILAALADSISHRKPACKSWNLVLENVRVAAMIAADAEARDAQMAQIEQLISTR